MTVWTLWLSCASTVSEVCVYVCVCVRACTSYVMVQGGGECDGESSPLCLLWSHWRVLSWPWASRLTSCAPSLPPCGPSLQDRLLWAQTGMTIPTPPHPSLPISGIPWVVSCELWVRLQLIFSPLPSSLCHQVVYCTMALLGGGPLLAAAISSSLSVGSVCTCRRAAAQWWRTGVGHKCSGILLQGAVMSLSLWKKHGFRAMLHALSPSGFWQLNWLVTIFCFQSKDLAVLGH